MIRKSPEHDSISGSGARLNKTMIYLNIKKCKHDSSNIEVKKRCLISKAMIQKVHILKLARIHHPSDLINGMGGGVLWYMVAIFPQLISSVFICLPIIYQSTIQA